MDYEKYKLVRNAFNDCYNGFYAKWSKKALTSTLVDEDWTAILNEVKEIAEKYEHSVCHSLVKNMLIDLSEILERDQKE